MIPLNYIFIPMLFGAPREMVTDLLLPGIIPFNLIKAGGNCLLTGILLSALQPVMAQYGLASKQIKAEESDGN